MTYFCKGTKKVNLQRVILKKRRQEVVSAGTPAAKQVKHDSSEVHRGSPGPANGLQQEAPAAIERPWTNSEQEVCEVVGDEGESARSQDVPGVADSNTELTGPCEAPNLT